MSQHEDSDDEEDYEGYCEYKLSHFVVYGIDNKKYI